MYNTYAKYILKTRKTQVIHQEFSLFAPGNVRFQVTPKPRGLNITNSVNFYVSFQGDLFLIGFRCCYQYQLVEELFFSKAS